MFARDIFCASIFRKALRLRPNTVPNGKITNLMSVDSNMIIMAMQVHGLHASSAPARFTQSVCHPLRPSPAQLETDLKPAGRGGSRRVCHWVWLCAVR